MATLWGRNGFGLLVLADFGFVITDETGIALHPKQT
jgi:hypothetical protein